jgi:hypothetical protein
MTPMLKPILAAAAVALVLTACNKPNDAKGDAAAAPAETVAPTEAAPAAAAPAEATPASGLPADVAALQEQFDLCEHFAGEEPYDAARRKEINDALAENCKPVKAAMPAIEAKYRDNAAVMAAVKNWHELLDAYDG